MEHRDPTRKATRPEVAWLHGRRHCVLGLDPAAHRRKKRGTGVSRLYLLHGHPRPIWTGDIENCSEGFGREEQTLAGELVANNPKGGKKGFSSPALHHRVPWHFTGRQGQRRAGATSLLPAPHCCWSEGCCWGRTGGKGGGQQEGALGDERAEGLQPARGDDSNGPPGQNVSNGLRPLLCDGEFWAKRRGLLGDLGSTGAVLVGLAHICQVRYRWYS